MEFTRLLAIVDDEPVFATDLLLAGAVDADDVRRQLSRWVQSGRLYQLRRGLYALAPPFQRLRPHPFLVANRLARGSYVSQQAALAHYGLIPETTPVVTSVTTRRPGRWETPLGAYEYRHVKTSLFFGYRLAEVSPGQRAFIAAPEKALLDLVHLHAGADDPAYLTELRLQNLERLDLELLGELAEQAASPKLRRAAATVARLARIEAAEYEEL
jgi:predicted transcriptional regulator of viral defense system